MDNIKELTLEQINWLLSAVHLKAKNDGSINQGALLHLQKKKRNLIEKEKNGGKQISLQDRM